ncbi:MAG: dTDP-4-dehydrorhamnose reductase [uncultured Lysobacter sp.]|uniref:dTDP-4-dehydrorhamnose reductase n=1 Tax=uncultured Lysobacter sp. TaxID=271060 RepID=A0A6J4M2D5_9GAMM|nr:MAG: dTDP-4-dehydrorhamnose reductase [uncultured Lysobacter sp.]
MRILLLGANGQVGHALRRSLVPVGEVVATTRSGTLEDGSTCEALDLHDQRAIASTVSGIRPDVVVNAAAYTAVDRAEDDAQAAHAINAAAPAAVARACNEIGAAVIHYSTDYVFDGTGQRPYRPADTTAPLGVYGASKLAGEQAVAASGAQHLILRTAWVYGMHGANFLRTMLRVGQEREELRVVADQIGSPTPAWLIADITAAIIRRGIGAGGTHHLVTEGQTSWHGFAEAIFEEALARGELPRAPRVVPIATAEYPTRARRPAYSVLDTRTLAECYGIELPHWRRALTQTFDSPQQP